MTDFTTIQVHVTADELERMTAIIDTVVKDQSELTARRTRGIAMVQALEAMPKEIFQLRKVLKERVDEVAELAQKIETLEAHIVSLDKEVFKNRRISSHLSELFVYATGGTPAEPHD